MGTNLSDLLNRVHHSDCVAFMKTLPDNCIDSIVTDPPYHLVSIVKRFGKEGSAPAKGGKDGSFKRLSGGFMGKTWDGVDENGIGIAQSVEMRGECLRILKPGGHLLSFSGTRTYHRMACAIEDAGFEVRDMIEWVYGSGFPKSLDIAKQIDKRGGKSVSWFGKWLREWREKENIPQKEIAKLFPSKTGKLTGCVANWELGLNMPTNEQFNLICETFALPFDSLEEAERHVVGINKNCGTNKSQGESMFGIGAVGKEVDITKGTSEWEGWGTALKPAHEPICMARKPLAEKTVAENCLKYGTGGINIDESRVGTTGARNNGNSKGTEGSNSIGVYGKAIKQDYNMGRFPANLILEDSEEVRECFPESKGGAFPKTHGSSGFVSPEKKESRIEMNDSGNASRFFKSILYYPKASKSERKLDDGSYSTHPTVKPIALMEYLIKMVTKEGGIVFDPFTGSGTTLVAAKKNGYQYLGTEMTDEYIPIIEARLNATEPKQEEIVDKGWFG